MPPANLDPGLRALSTQKLESGVQPFHRGTPEAAGSLLASLCTLSGAGLGGDRVEAASPAGGSVALKRFEPRARGCFTTVNSHPATADAERAALH